MYIYKVKYEMYYFILFIKQLNLYRINLYLKFGYIYNSDKFDNLNILLGKDFIPVLLIILYYKKYIYIILIYY